MRLNQHADVGWGANPNVAMSIGMVMLGFTFQPTGHHEDGACAL